MSDDALPPGAEIGGLVVRRLLRAGPTGFLYLAATADGAHRLLRELFPPNLVARRDDGAGLRARRGQSGRFSAERARFLAIAEALTGLDARGLDARGLDAPIAHFAHGNALYAVESARGARLPQALKRGVAVTAASILRDVAEGLEALHRRGLLHLDIKPSNVTLHEDGRAALADPWSGRPIGPGPWEAATVAGSPGYAAPEIAAGAPPEPAADVWGLCALGHALLTGGPPQGAAPKTAPAGASPALWAALRQGLDPDPAARPDLAALIAVLGRLESMGPPVETIAPDAPTQAMDLPAPAPAPARAPAPPPNVQRARRGPPRWAFAALALILLVGGWRGVVFYQWWTKTEWIVDPQGGGDAESIAEAVDRARAGVFIYVLPGTYAEPLEIEENFIIAGVTGDVNDVVIAPPAGRCLWAAAENLSFSNLSFSGPAEDGVDVGRGAPCVMAAAGALTLENVTIADADGPALLVGGGARATLRESVIAGAGGHGVVFEDGGGGLMAEVEIRDAAWAGVLARTGAAPTLRGVRILSPGAAGLLVSTGGRAVAEDVEIEAAGRSAIEARRGGRIEALRVTLTRPAEAGVFIHDGGAGLLETVRIDAPGFSGIVLGDDGEAEIRDAAILAPAEHGAALFAGATGLLRGISVETPGLHAIARDPLAGVAVEALSATGGREPALRESAIGPEPAPGEPR